MAYPKALLKELDSKSFDECSDTVLWHTCPLAPVDKTCIGLRHQHCLSDVRSIYSRFALNRLPFLSEGLRLIKSMHSFPEGIALCKDSALKDSALKGSALKMLLVKSVLHLP
jgi:hypothetical protein